MAMRGELLLLVSVAVLCVALPALHTDPADHHPLLPNRIPISAVRRGLAPHGYRGDRRHLHAALVRAFEEKLLRVGVVGGSVPYGRGLSSPRKLSWPAACEEFLRVHLGNLREDIIVKVLNLAIPAAPSYVQSQFTDNKFWAQLRSCHVVIVDITVNDRPEHGLLLETGRAPVVADGRQLMRALLRDLVFKNQNAESPTPIGLLYFETYSNFFLPNTSLIHTPQDIGENTKDTTVRSTSMSQRFLRSSMSTTVTPKKKTPRLSTQVSGPKSAFDKDLSKTHVKDHHKKPSALHSYIPMSCRCPVDVAKLVHWPALVTYLIPVLSWPTIVCQQEVDMNLCDAFPHPTSLFHRYMGKVVAFAIYELLLDALKNVTSSVHFNETQALRDMLNTSVPFAATHLGEWESFVAQGALEHKVEKLVTSRDGMDESDCDMEERLTVLSAAGGSKFYPDFHGTQWSFGEDIKGNGKYGWIANNRSSFQNEAVAIAHKKGSFYSSLRKLKQFYNDMLKMTPKKLNIDMNTEIIFKFTTKRNVLRISVLKSYAPYMGTMGCCVDCLSFTADHIITTKWNHEASVESSQVIPFINITSPDNALNCPAREKLLRCRALDRNKVKIMSIVSC